MKKKILIKAAKSSHKKCFICNKSCKQVTLREIKIDTVTDAYLKKGLYVKRHARCCSKHLDEKFRIKYQYYAMIKYSLIKPSSSVMMTLFLISNQKKYIFEEFRDIDNLSENTCLKITGWTKEIFISFSNYITSINDTDGRTKYQLIALYRYWLRKGIDQSSLALLFNDKTSQNQISHYLSQIRKAISKDFVPYFLGAKKGKEFFLFHNNITTSELHNLKPNDLAIFADGTYCRCEKSSNNQVQYDCYSDQKKDSLIKPFLICCADGYIIDCYGPFKANKNDATILDYILDKDEDLMNILEPDKTYVFIDRGFRDIFSKLKDDFMFNPKMPTCKQLEKVDDHKINEENQLTIKQTTESRFVTKCRYIIEKVNGKLKILKALDNIRNTEIAHIQTDYRNACAMINFTHKPCCPDGNNSLKIAKKMKEKALYNQNHLEFLLSKQLDTRIISSISLSSIEDFPKLSVKTLKDEIFFGSFQYKQCQSYYEDIVNGGKAFLVSIDLLKMKSNDKNRFVNSKVLAFEIPSRHRRSLLKKQPKKKKKSIYKNNYKVFVHYTPNINNFESIKGYICNCLSGRKIVGCCVHVAAVIGYLGFQKYEFFRPKAQHLQKIFVNMDEGELPNINKNIRIKKQKLIKLEKDPSMQDLSETNTIENDATNLRSNQESFDEHSNNNFGLILNEFIRRIPKWGAIIEYKEQKNVKLTNTCSIDYLMFALWCASKLRENFLHNIPVSEKKEFLIKIINLINIKKWDKAREVWVNKIMRINHQLKQNELSLFGSEMSKFVQFISDLQKHKLIQICSEDCIQNRNLIVRYNSEFIFFVKDKNKIEIDSCFTSKCNLCKSNINSDIKFHNDPNFLIIQAKYLDIFLKDIPNEIELDKKKFQYLTSTFSVSGHFKGIFKINNEFFLVNDMDQSAKKITAETQNEPLSSIFYIRK